MLEPEIVTIDRIEKKTSFISGIENSNKIIQEISQFSKTKTANQRKIRKITQFPKIMKM